MATRREPRFKLCRRLGVNVCGHPNAMNRAGQAGRPARKQSDYAKQLIEKQKIKAYYGILEGQFRRYIEKSQMSKEITGNALLRMLECRLDNIVYRLGLGKSIRQARQFVNHGHILVNGKKVDIPSYSVKVNDVISVAAKSNRMDKIHQNIADQAGSGVLYLERDLENLRGKLTRMPGRDEIPVDVNEILAIELYSK